MRQVVHAALALLLLVTLTLQLVVTIHHLNATLGVRLVRLVSYFTIQSNVLVLITSAALAWRPDRDDRLWKVLRIDALAGIGVTGLVYTAVLAGTQRLHGAALFCDTVFHYVVPIAAVGTWLLLGPRPRMDGAVVLRALIWPVLWFAYTLIHGAVSRWYPYPFVDVTRYGYPRVLLNVAVVVVLMTLLLLVLAFVDRRAPTTDDPARRVGQ